MKTISYELSPSEHACLQYSVAFLLTAFIYGLLASRIVLGLARPEMTTFLRDFPVLLLNSLGAGFLCTATIHYAIRMLLQPASKGEML